MLGKYRVVLSNMLEKLILRLQPIVDTLRGEQLEYSSRRRQPKKDKRINRLISFWVFSLFASVIVFVAKGTGLYVSGHTGQLLFVELLKNGELLLLSIALVLTSYGQYNEAGAGAKSLKEKRLHLGLMGLNTLWLLFLGIVYGFVFAATGENDVIAINISVISFLFSIFLGHANTKLAE